jgi:hypothetical protein
MLNKLNKITEFKHKNPVAIGCIYIFLIVALITILWMGGVINPTSTSFTPEEQAAPPASTSTPASKERINDHIVTATPWQNASINLAKQKLKDMDKELAISVKINHATLNDYVIVASNINTSQYYLSTNKLTDLIKQTIAQPGTTYEEVNHQCNLLDEAYTAWQETAWSTAIETLNNQIKTMNAMAATSKQYLRAHSTYPRSCQQWAQGDIETSKGSTQQDFFAAVATIENSNTQLEACGADMSPEQSSLMPQDQEIPSKHR